MLLSSSAVFSKLFFSKHSFRNTIRVSNSLDSDQDRYYVGPDLGQNCKEYQQTTKLPSMQRVNSAFRVTK